MDIVTNGRAQYECMKAISKEFPSTAAVTVMDLSVEAEAFEYAQAFKKAGANGIII